MEDTWLHSFTSPPAAVARSQHRRRASLLEQTRSEAKAEISVDAIAEGIEIENAWSGPPKATPARRAQSYSDFYRVVRSLGSQEKSGGRKDSLDSGRKGEEHGHGEQLIFDDDFAKFEDALLEQSHFGYHAYHEQLVLSDSHLEHLIDSTHQTLELLSSLSTSFKMVQAQTDSFRQQCESLMEEQKHLEGLADAVEENSHYYAFLEPMTRRLNAPGAVNLVTSKDFPQMLSNLDVCLAYMEAHPKQRESATYRSRYRLLLTRALTLIRHHVTKVLGEIAADISKRIQGGQLKETTHSALLYAKFRVPAPELRELGSEIFKRASTTPEELRSGREPEYLSLMRELYQSYSATRGRLILPLVNRKMAELQIANTPQQSDVLTFSHAIISYMRGICLDEHELWSEWFEAEGPLYDFLETLMDPMFDYLRPRIIHETKLEKLCDLCAMIQSRYMDLESEDEEEGSSGHSTPVVNGRSGIRKFDFPSLVAPALEDAQTRLVFLAMNVLREGIESYKPTPEDLDWPKNPATLAVDRTSQGPVLSGMRGTTLPVSKSPSVEVDEAHILFGKSSSKSLHLQTWYPTLRKAIWLLRRIYRLVNSSVFDDLAHRIVHSTIHSLLYARQQVTRAKDKTAEDGKLFLITHLLHLKQQIVAFDIEFIPPEVEFDFSSVTNTFYELRERGALWNPTSWVRLVGGAVGGGLLPKVVKNMLDAKAELDGHLRTVINELVNNYATHITAPIEQSVIGQLQKSKDSDGFDAPKAIRTIRGLAEKDVPLLRKKLAEYVDDLRTRETLVAAVRDQVVMTYEEFWDSQNDGGPRKLSRKGKGRENEVWDPEIFGEAMERVFQVGQMVNDEIDEDDVLLERSEAG